MGTDRDTEDRTSEEAGALSVLADGLAPQRPSPELRRELMARVRGEQRYHPFCQEVSEAFGVSADVVRDAFAHIHDERAWQPGGELGGASLNAPALAQVGVVIARIPPGTRIAKHDHSGREQTYVLNGVLVENVKNDSRTLTTGHLLVAEPGHEHALTVAGDAPCLVVFSASVG